MYQARIILIMEITNTKINCNCSLFRPVLHRNNFGLNYTLHVAYPISSQNAMHSSTSSLTNLVIYIFILQHSRKSEFFTRLNSSIKIERNLHIFLNPKLPSSKLSHNPNRVPNSSWPCDMYCVSCKGTRVLFANDCREEVVTDQLIRQYVSAH